MTVDKNVNENIEVRKTPVETNLQELTEGCSKVITTYSLEESLLAKTGFETRKIVVFFSDGLDFEMVARGVHEVLMAHDQSLVKTELYCNKTGNWLKSAIHYGITLFRDIIGFSPNCHFTDFREVYRNFKSRGRTQPW